MGKSCSSQFRKLAATSTLVFAGISAAFVLGPEISANTNATNGCVNTDGVVTCGVETQVEVTVNSVLTIGVKADGKPDTDYVYNGDSTPASMNLNLGSATPGGPFTRNAVDVKVTTNSTNGYRLTMNTATANPYLANETEADKNAPTKDRFHSEAGDYTVTGPTNSRWGYALADDAAHVEAVSGSGSPLQLRPRAGYQNDTDTKVSLGTPAKEYTGAPATDGSVTKVYFFAQAKSSMPAGTYGNSVVFSATEAP